MRNYGAYIARYKLTYTVSGRDEVYQTDWFLAGQERGRTIPASASQIRIKVENMIFILIWRTVYETRITPWSDFCLQIGGTTLDPSMNFC